VAVTTWPVIWLRAPATLDTEIAAAETDAAAGELSISSCTLTSQLAPDINYASNILHFT